MFANNELEAYVLGFRLICSTIGANLDSRAENANFKGVFLVCTCCFFPPPPPFEPSFFAEMMSFRLSVNMIFYGSIKSFRLICSSL